MRQKLLFPANGWRIGEGNSWFLVLILESVLHSTSECQSWDLNPFVCSKAPALSHSLPYDYLIYPLLTNLPCKMIFLWGKVWKNWVELRWGGLPEIHYSFKGDTCTGTLWEKAGFIMTNPSISPKLLSGIPNPAKAQWLLRCLWFKALRTSQK